MAARKTNQRFKEDVPDTNTIESSVCLDFGWSRKRIASLGAKASGAFFIGEVDECLHRLVDGPPRMQAWEGGVLQIRAALECAIGHTP